MHSGTSIPYSGYHVGARRTLGLALRGGTFGSRAVHVTVDGATHVLPWGRVALEVPADRPVSISVHQVRTGNVGALAAITLMPHDPPELEYRSPHGPAWTDGAIGRPGTVRARGGLLVYLVLVPAMLMVLLVFCLLIGALAW